MIGSALEEANVEPGIRVKDLSDDELVRIQKEVEKYPVEAGELRACSFSKH